MYDFLFNFYQRDTCKSIRLLTDKEHEIHPNPRITFFCTTEVQNHLAISDFGPYINFAGIPILRFKWLLVYGPEKYYLPLRNDL